MSNEEKLPWRPNVIAGETGLENCSKPFLQAQELTYQILTFKDPLIFQSQFRTVVFSLLMAIDGGWTDEGLIWIAQKLPIARFVSQDAVLIHNEIPSVGTKTVRVWLPPSARLFVHACRQSNTVDNPVEYLSVPQTVDSASLNKAFRMFQDQLGYSAPINLNDFCACIRVKNITHMPNLVVTLLSSEPGAQDYSPLLPLQGSQQLTDITSQDTFQTLLTKDPPETTYKSAPQPATTSTKPSDWQSRAHGILSDLLSEFEAIHVSAGKDLEARKRLSSAAAKEAKANLRDAEFPETSSADLAVEWAVHRFHSNRRPKGDTVKKYVATIFFNGLFEEPEAFDLIDWDDEDWDELAASILDHATTPDSQEGYENLLYDFLQFASAKFRFVPSNVHTQLRGRSEAVRRALVMSPTHIDAITRALISRGTRHHKQMAAAILIAFYGGLRPKEVRTLSINRIIGDASDLHIFIDKSKNKQSRRWVNLSVLAPTWTLEWLAKFRDERASEFDTAELQGHAALFGPTRVSDALHAQALIVPAINYLKSVFGDNAVFYSLRHSFASWNFVRIMSFKHQSIPNSLADGQHETFSYEFLKRLREFFAAPEHNAPAIPVTSVISLARLMGHSGYTTLFERYVHTLNIVLPSIYDHWFTEQANRRLTRQACRNLTGYTSSSTLASLPRTVGGMVQELEQRAAR